MDLIAHRAGNELALLRAAEQEAAIIEVDVHLDAAGQVEVRHAKSLWLSSRMWDRWYFLPNDQTFPSLSEILEASDPETLLWLDLKGFTSRLTTRALSAVDKRRPLIVSSKSWWLLKPCRGLDEVTVLRSVGNRLELALLRWAPNRASIDGVVIHRRLLSKKLIERLTRRGLLYTWAVDDIQDVIWLARAGIDGVIVDDLSLIRQSRAALPADS